ncbi:hypothetical protein GGS26DRAFT_556589 [Hypomontagnella submonticulosa]|nr:hypothetical protein GGS26DRAFT_556589 [Hypomontagnella submonticulosa]
MPRPKPNHDFEIYVDQSCLNTPMDGENYKAPTAEAEETSVQSEEATSVANKGNTDTKGNEGVTTANSNKQDSGIRLSIEADADEEMGGEHSTEHPDNNNHGDAGDSSILSEMTDDTHHRTQADHSYLDHSDFVDSHIPQPDDGGDSSSHHEATDEDVFSDKSPRSSLGSYDGIPEPSKARRDFDNMTTVTRSPRVSDISQYEREYEKEEFIPTVRGTPRPPFRTPSDVRAMQMSSPPPSVLGSPRSTKRHFPTVSRLGTPTASAQYSPKRMSTPTRFKSHKEAPLVLLHVTVFPLQWVWGDLLNTLDADGMSEQVKSLRESWRVLQDRATETVLERGVLVNHPQNDYEVLEERLLEALDLPLRRRARILECGHYLGPSNETTLEEDDESEDEWGSDRTRGEDKRHWCSTCKNEIRYDALGPGRVYRVKIYASNGLMKAGAWAACWKEMERVDAEIEPIVEPAVQEELVRLAASQQERELARQEEAEIAKEVAHHLEEQRRKEQQAGMMSPRFGATSPRPESERVGSPISEEERRRRDEERLREIYGQSPPPPSPRQPPSRAASVHLDHDAYNMPPPPSPPSTSQESYGHKDPRPQTYQNASLPELLLQSVRVLMQDRKNVVIFTLSIFVLMLALRNAPSPPEPAYSPKVHRMRDVPTMRHTQASESTVAASFYAQSPKMMTQQHTQSAEPVATYEETPRIIQEQDIPIEEPIESTRGSYQHSVGTPQEASGAMARQPTTESKPAEAQLESEEPLEDIAEQNTSTVEYATAMSDFQSPIIESPQQEASQGDFATAAAVSYAQEAMEAVSEPTVVQESVTATPSVCTIYEPCDTSAASQGKRSTVTVRSEEAETITEKTKVFHTITETDVETIKVTATEVPKHPLPLEAKVEASSEDSDAASLLELEGPPVGETAGESIEP